MEDRIRHEASWLFTAIGEASRQLADAPGRARHARELTIAEQLADLRTAACPPGFFGSCNYDR